MERFSKTANVANSSPRDEQPFHHRVPLGGPCMARANRQPRCGRCGQRLSFPCLTPYFTNKLRCPDEKGDPLFGLVLLELDAHSGRYFRVRFCGHQNQIVTVCPAKATGFGNVAGRVNFDVAVAQSNRSGDDNLG
jgi:hypothetical protein